MRKLTVMLLGALTVGACTDDALVLGPVPGLDAPSCDLSWVAYRVTSVELPVDYDHSRALALDLDGKNYDGPDNAIGSLMGSVATQFPESWDPTAAMNARLAAGQTAWVLEVGRCADGDEVRVVSARAGDADGDGRLEVFDRGLAAVGLGGGGPLVAVRGMGWMPVGGLFGASPTAGTDAWQIGLSLTTALDVTGDRVTGRLGIALDPDTEAVLTPVRNFFNERLVAGTSAGARAMDTNQDGVIDAGENRTMVLGLLNVDLDLGECDRVECYLPTHPDGINDHASLGLAITADRVELE